MQFSDILTQSVKNNIKCVPCGPNEYCLQRNNMTMKFSVFNRNFVEHITYKNSKNVIKTFTNMNEVVSFMNGHTIEERIKFSNGTLSIVNKDIVICFNGIPDESTRKNLKDRGFDYTDKTNVWYNSSCDAKIKKWCRKTFT